MSAKARVPEVNSALQIVKGAIDKVLGGTKTVNVECHKKSEGRITIVSEIDVPAPQLQIIEQFANETISHNIPIETEVLSRAEAESKYGKDKIYDKMEPPASVQELTIVQIKDWVTNACLGTHVGTTSSVRPVKILRCNFKEGKKEATIVFELGAAPSSTASSLVSPSPVPASPFLGVPATTLLVPAKKEAPLTPFDDVRTVSKELVALLLKDLKEEGIDLKGKENLLQERLENRTFTKVNAVKNVAFTRGSSSKITPAPVKMGLSFPKGKQVEPEQPVKV
eukprot:TRINITY_DN4045_c0_g1_i2.p1 TRINITY_DN4045_c0_g1~~TRINITY_DN4045_c0_g1_i2.p1  ORF type:complete len:281 (+),score=92.76 TRINITY_DN4045_c0_g1_i2:950-1792(+)